MAVTVDSVLWNETVPIQLIPVTVKTVGVQFVDDAADKQAAVLIAMADELQLWGPNESWPMQCHNIAVELSDEDRVRVKTMLRTLVDHL